MPVPSGLNDRTDIGVPRFPAEFALDLPGIRNERRRVSWATIYDLERDALADR